MKIETRPQEVNKPEALSAAGKVGKAEAGEAKKAQSSAPPPGPGPAVQVQISSQAHEQAVKAQSGATSAPNADVPPPGGFAPGSPAAKAYARKHHHLQVSPSAVQAPKVESSSSGSTSVSSASSVR